MERQRIPHLWPRLLQGISKKRGEMKRRSAAVPKPLAWLSHPHEGRTISLTALDFAGDLAGLDLGRMRLNGVRCVSNTKEDANQRILGDDAVPERRRLRKAFTGRQGAGEPGVRGL